MTNNHLLGQVQGVPELHFPNSQTCLLSLGASQNFPRKPFETLGFKFGEAVLRPRPKSEVRGKFGRWIHWVFTSFASYGAQLLPPKGGVIPLARLTLPLGGRRLCSHFIITQNHGGVHGSN